MQKVLFQELQAGTTVFDWDWNDKSGIDTVGPRFSFTIKNKGKKVVQFLLTRPRVEEIFKIFHAPIYISFELEKRDGSIAVCRGFIEEFPSLGSTRGPIYMLRDSKGSKLQWPNFSGDWLQGNFWIIFKRREDTSSLENLHMGIFRSDADDAQFLVFSYRGGIYERVPYYFLVLAVGPLERQSAELQYFVPLFQSRNKEIPCLQ